MKVKVNRKDTSKDNEFPMLMESVHGKVIIATGVDDNDLEGVLLEASNSLHYKIGHHSSGWHRPSFKKFNGSVTISND